MKIPKEYQRHSKVFSEEESHRFPPSRPWDHAIELKEGVPEAINCKIIPTTREEDEALKKFINEQLEKGYIRKSKLLRLDFTHTQIRWTASFLSPLFLTPKPMYDTILRLARVRYDLASCLHTIRSRVLLLYDINLRATHTTILSSGGVQIPIDLVSSATDSFQ